MEALYLLLQVGIGFALLVITICRANEMTSRAKITYKVSYIGLAVGGTHIFLMALHRQAVDWPLLVLAACMGLLMLTTRMRWLDGMPADAVTTGTVRGDLKELVRGL